MLKLNPDRLRHYAVVMILKLDVRTLLLTTLKLCPHLYLDVTLPSALACTSGSSKTEPVWFGSGDGRRCPAHIQQVYHEMIHIYEKLQVRERQTLRDL